MLNCGPVSCWRMNINSPNALAMAFIFGKDSLMIVHTKTCPKVSANENAGNL